MGGPVALYAVVAALAIAAPLSAQQSAAPPEPAAVVPAAPADPAAPAATPAEPAPVPAEPAPAAPAPAAPAPAAPAPAPAAPAPAPQVLNDDQPVKQERKSKPIATAAASTGVTIKDFDFTAATVTVNVGDTVTWTNNGPTPHSATSTGGVWDTGIMDAGQSGSHTFDQAGTFSYICTPHPNMKGTVVVQAAAAQTGGGDDSGTAGDTTSGGAQADDGPSLPSTGMDVGGLLVLGLATLALGVYLRRRTEPQPARPAGRIGW